MRKYTRWTKELLEPIVKESITYADCLRKMGLVQAGGNFSTLQRNIDKFNIDTGHMLGQAHNRGKEIKYFENLSTPSAIKKRLINDLGNSCQQCKN